MEMQKGILSLFDCFLFYSFVYLFVFSRFNLRDFIVLFVLDWWPSKTIRIGSDSTMGVDKV